MAIIAGPATPGYWLDTDQVLTAPVIAAAAAEGYKGVFRYAPLPGVSAQHDISRDELLRIIAGGLELGIVQHPRYAGWDPTTHSGSADAMHAVQYAQHEGYPLDAHVAVDAEGVHPNVVADQLIKFLDDWQTAARLLRARAMLYHGYQVPLSAQQLYYLHGYDCYWRGLGGGEVDVRGHAVIQGAAVEIVGTKFDSNTVREDKLGGLPWVAKMGT